MEIVDAYLHCGLKKYRLIEEVRRTMRRAGVARGVLVQHLGEYDNGYVGSIVAADRTHFAGVALVDDTQSDAPRTLKQLAAQGGFSGIRVVAESLESAPDLWEVAVETNLILVHYAPHGMGDTLGALKTFLDLHPDCRLVLTHLGYPDVAEAPNFPEYRPVFDLAEYPGVHYQISGMKMFCSYPDEELYPLIALAVERFGPERLLWGSNYPVVGDASDYINDLNLLLDGHLPIPNKDIPLVAGANARRLWFPDSHS